MDNYNDYELEEMENEAVNKSNNFKKAAVVGAAVLGVGGTAAFAASKLGGEDDTLTEDDLLGVAEAGEVEDEAIESQENEEKVEEVHHHHHHHHHVAATPAPEPDVAINETGVVYDENGNYIGMFDEGTYDGKAVALYDLDGNGRADVIAYDANNNGHFEADEYSSMDNKSYVMGQGAHVAHYIKDQNGVLHQFDNQMAYDPSHITSPKSIIYDESRDENGENSQIHNDFRDEKGGEHFDDLANNNPDYNNHADDNSYSASMSDGLAYDYDEKYNGSIEDNFVEENYADSLAETSYAEENYAENSYDENVYEAGLADDTTAETSFDDMSSYDAGVDLV